MGAYISQDPIRLAGGKLGVYNYVKDLLTLIDLFGLSELVYQLVDSNGDVTYYGITERSALERANEHAHSGKNFDHMEVIAEDLTHDQARSLEGAKIRDRLSDRAGSYDIDDSIADQLDKSGLQNKNRGRVRDRWSSNNPIADVEQLDKPRKVVPTATCK